MSRRHKTKAQLEHRVSEAKFGAICAAATRFELDHPLTVVSSASRTKRIALGSGARGIDVRLVFKRLAQGRAGAIPVQAFYDMRLDSLFDAWSKQIPQTLGEGDTFERACQEHYAKLTGGAHIDLRVVEEDEEVEVEQTFGSIVDAMLEDAGLTDEQRRDLIYEHLTDESREAIGAKIFHIRYAEKYIDGRTGEHPSPESSALVYGDLEDDLKHGVLLMGIEASLRAAREEARERREGRPPGGLTKELRETG